MTPEDLIDQLFHKVALAPDEREEAALDELLAVLGKFDEPEARERDEEMLRLQAETRLLIDQINRRLHVEKVL